MTQDYFLGDSLDFLQARKKDQANFLQPSANDVKRYNWYLENAFDLEALPKLPQDIIDNFRIKCGRPITFSESKEFSKVWKFHISVQIMKFLR